MHQYTLPLVPNCDLRFYNKGEPVHALITYFYCVINLSVIFLVVYASFVLAIKMVHASIH